MSGRTGAPLSRCSSGEVRVEKMIDKNAKAEYDRQYRKKNRARIKANKAAYFQRTYDPVKAAKERKKNMAAHKENETCNQQVQH